MADRHIPDDARAEIERRLDAIESEFAVRIVFACESGSRAWGFASPDSDYDVRFLYVSQTNWYLSVDLEEKRDVIETPIEGVWDVNGWDLRKALRLYRKSNPPLLEWLQSPIVYSEFSGAAEKMRSLLPSFYSPPASMYHYLHMAQKNFRTYLQESEVWTKKYFYVLRPLLACRWVEADRGAVPMEFEHLVDASNLPGEALQAISMLLEEKRDGAELRRGPRVAVLNDLIESEFARFEAAGVTRRPPEAQVDQLSVILQETLAEVWAPS
jgi:predicted nucleotidyltransferase